MGKVFAPADEPPQEEVSPSAHEDPLREMAALPPLGATDRQDVPEIPRPGRPFWRTMDEDAPEADTLVMIESTVTDPTPAPEPPASETPAPGKPLWQTVVEDTPEDHTPAAAQSTAADAAPASAQEPSAPPPRELPKSQQKSRVRSYAPQEKVGGRQKLMTALIPVLTFLMIVVLKHPLGARPTVQAAGIPSRPPVHPAAANVEIAWQVPAPYELGGRDPMRSVAQPVVAESPETPAPSTESVVELTVTGILYSADRPAAIVDTQVVHEGQQISGATILKIDRDGVEFERSGRRWRQTVDQEAP